MAMFLHILTDIILPILVLALVGFVTQKLLRMDIRTLPCLVSFIDGAGVDRLLGFEGVSETEEFSTSMLEKRLAQSSILLLM